MMKNGDMEKLLDKIQNMEMKNLNLLNILKLLNIFLDLRKKKNIEYIKIFIREYYCLEEDMPDDFYELVLNQMCNNNYLTFFNILLGMNIYSLISYLKYNQEDISSLEDVITPLQYYITPRRYINRIIEKLRELEIENTNSDDNNYLDSLLKEEDIWLLKRRPQLAESGYRMIAYKIYLSVGLDNGLELLSGKYGEIDYEKIYFLFEKLHTKDNFSKIYHQTFNNFLFEDKRDLNNVIRQMLDGRFKELFLNFDYFYNNISYFIDKLGIKMTRNKVKLLLDERYLTYDVSNPQITGDILDDMLSSYYCKYDTLDTPKEEIYRKNYETYNEFLRKKYKSSIPMIELKNNGEYLCEVISLSNPRNLVLGYRAGNCFRINGDASVLFHNFLQSEHMRLISISTLEYKDYAMMLVMRNGNVLIGQGIEVSKWVPMEIKGKKLYDTCREILKEMMDYMNSHGDEIVATVIGSSNENVSRYNNQLLPFLINPILENGNNYYNGIYNYQCLLDISEGKSLQDIRLYTPSVRYLDKRESILRRTRNEWTKDNNYLEIEKRLISFRFLRFKNGDGFALYQKLLSHRELYTCCNIDWYITLFDDGTIDSFIFSDDERAIEENEIELLKIQEKLLENNKKMKNNRKRVFTLK